MQRKQFSTGLPRLDHYTGGLGPGDSLLSFLSSPDQRKELLDPLAEYSSASKIPVIYCSPDVSSADDLSVAYRAKRLPPVNKGAKAAVVMAGIKKFIRKPRRFQRAV